MRVFGLVSHWTRLSPETPAISLQSFIFPSLVCSWTLLLQAVVSKDQERWIAAQYTAVHSRHRSAQNAFENMFREQILVCSSDIYLFYCIWIFFPPLNGIKRCQMFIYFFLYIYIYYVLMFVFLYAPWPSRVKVSTKSRTSPKFNHLFLIP